MSPCADYFSAKWYVFVRGVAGSRVGNARSVPHSTTDHATVEKARGLRLLTVAKMVGTSTKRAFHA